MDYFAIARNDVTTRHYEKIFDFRGNPEEPKLFTTHSYHNSFTAFGRVGLSKKWNKIKEKAGIKNLLIK